MPGRALEPQSGARYYRQHQDAEGRISFSTHTARRFAGHSVPAAVPGRVITTAHGSLDSNQMFVVSSVRNDEIAFHGPNPFASNSARPWAGESGMKPHLAAPSMQPPDARAQAESPPLLASKAHAPGRLNGASDHQLMFGQGLSVSVAGIVVQFHGLKPSLYQRLRRSWAT